MVFVQTLFSVTGRMVIGAVLALALVIMLKLPMEWHRQARRTYLSAGLGIYGAMMMVYWAAQYIPSGWISVIFGLSPVITGWMAARWLKESTLTAPRLAALVLALLGLLTIFYSGGQISNHAGMGVMAMLISVILHSASSVMVKHNAYQAHGLVITTGGLLVAVPLYLLTWFVSGSSWPEQISTKSIVSIVYLGIFGSVLGFALYYSVLKQVSATRVALITLVTPVSALWLGHWLNGEIINMTIIAGTLLILSGLILFEWSDRNIKAG
ncbi:MAG: DMT family transporter [gamma proteobacterium symbiont of Bathyaustriella thionipta]|nr:DMT family transporter [gamma proteobacterium symbiont of Bathyaustriella thionipta]